MENHLIIGLGGTGGKIIRSIRKTIFQEFGKNDPERVNIRYLYVDSSPEMMSIDDPSWNVLGKSVQLSLSSQVLIKGENLGQKLKEIDSFPGIAPWIGDKSQWTDVVNSLIGEAAGGQKRRLGRFLLACRISDVTNNLKTQVSNLQREDSDVTFHICAGLAGGTGSGSIIDIIAQIRASDYVHTDNNNRFRIFLYTYLPELTPKPGRNTGNYHANGYAALLELNALSIGAYKPVDIEGKKGRLEVPSPFEGCFLFTNQNEKGKIVDPDQELPDIVSSFLFESIVGSKFVDFGSSGKRDFYENLNPVPETSPTNPLVPERSLNFLTFGIKKLAIPEQEIKEYLIYNFAEQASRQLKFNNWSQVSGGFEDSPKNINFDINVREPRNLNNWKLTWEHLTLSKPVIEDANTVRWRPIDDQWVFLKSEYAKLAMQKDSKMRLSELESLFNKQYEEQYRQLGVKKFYQASLMSNNLKSIVNEIKKKIENELFSSWMNGDLSLFDISLYLQSLIKFNEERLTSIEDFIEKQKTVEASKKTSIKENVANWSKLGMIGEFLKSQKIFVAQCDLLEELYKSKTKLEGFDFAKRLTKEINSELYALKEEVESANKTVSIGIDEFNSNIRSRVTDKELDLNNLNNFQDQVVRFYDPRKVIQLNEKLIRDEDLQKQQTSNIRRHIVTNLLGNAQSFSLFNQRIDSTVFFNELQLKSAETIESVTSNNSISVFGVNIVDKLKKEYGGNVMLLRKLMTNLMDYASAFAPINNDQVIKSQPGTSKEKIKTTKMIVILPKTENVDPFQKQLEEIIAESKPSHIQEIVLFYTDRNSYEITFISNTSVFPLRFIKQTQILKEKYDLLVSASDSSKVRMLLHSEGDGTNLPPLFLEEINVIIAKQRDKAVLYLLLGKAIGVIKEKKDEYGFNKLALVDNTEVGEQTMHWFDKTLIDSYRHLDILEYNRLKIEQAISSKFEKGYKQLNQLTELKGALIKEVQQVENLLGNSDPDYQKILSQANNFIRTQINPKIA